MDKLLARLADEDTAAFEIIFRQYYPKVHAFSLGLLKDEEDADDVTQQVFIKLWNRRLRMNLVHDFNAYLYRMTRNSVLDFIEKRQKKRDFVDIELVSDMPTADSTFDQIAAIELQLLVDMIVANMPKQRRKIYKLSRERGKSNQEIADELGIAKKTVENHMHLALAELKKALGIFLLIVNALGVS